MRKLVIYITIISIILSSCTYEEHIGWENDTDYASEDDEENTLDKENIYFINEKSLTSGNLIYLGAFRLPEDGELESEMFSYGGEALCYNSSDDSLFITGHNWYANVAEISIPEYFISDNVAALNESIKLNGFTDIKGKLFDKWTMEIPRAGLEVIGDKLFFCFGEHYEENTSKGTHGYTNFNLSKADKVCIVGDYLYSTNDYMFSVPEEYKKYLGGNDILTGRFRDGGWGGMGPSLFAISSKNIISSDNNERIQAVTLIKYDDSYNGDEGKTMRNYSHADSWSGGAFVQCEAGSAIIFIGTHGYGDTWYGFANGVIYPTDGDENAIYPDVPDYPYDERGWWNDDFRACIAFYSTEDIIKVYNGQMVPADIQPFEFADLSDYMMVDRDETVMQYLGAAAYDSENNRLFVLELMADDSKPVVHVFTFE